MEESVCAVRVWERESRAFTGSARWHARWPTRAQFADYIERMLATAYDRTTTRAERMVSSSEISVNMSQSRYPSERRHDAYEAFEPLAELRRELLGTEP